MEKIIIDGVDESTLPLSLGVTSGNLIYLSGMISKDLATGKALPGTIEEETTRVMENIGVILRAAGSDFTKVIKTTVYLCHMEEFSRMNEIYKKYFQANSFFPSRSAVGVSLVGDVRIEIEIVAQK
ncbi:MAG: Rid family hydrolase [Sphaerochaeta sp.]|nr:Rid family hydrolase [Sphaerochaeta sp.]